MNLIDDTSTQQPQPGSLNFVPADPEIPIESIAPIAEVLPPVETGVETKQENEPIYETPKQPEQKPVVPQPVQPVVTVQPVPNVVDKSNEPIHTHHLDKTKDKLTALADEDEEKFIQEVESAHGHK